MERNEAIGRLRQLYSETNAENKAALECLIPELAESEDERIRKELKEAFESYDIESMWNGIPIRSIFAWLENQKEQKPSGTEALKDLPRWKPAARAYDGDRLPKIDRSLNRLVARFDEGIFYLDIRELYKLPGFKEEQE